MLTLKRLAELGHSIAVVIHQPRTSIFNMFDKAGYMITNILHVIAELEKISPRLISVMKESNINVETLDGESKHFQYIIKAVKK